MHIFAFDITERKNREEELKQAKTEAKKANEQLARTIIRKAKKGDPS